MSYPKRADHFREWSKLMLEQATVPDRVQYKTTSAKSVKGMKKRWKKRRKRFRSRKRNKEQ